MISIIMPVYKAEKYLDRAVKSVLNQTHTDFELLLVDDGSPDNSGAMCDEWATKDSRIKTFHKTNGGISDARNYGIQNACGEYITFIDNDDYVMPTWLEDMHTVAKNTGADLVKCGFYYVRDNNTEYDIAELDYSLKPFYTAQFENEQISIQEYYCRLSNIFGYSAVWNQLVKADIQKKCLFKKGSRYEDYNLFFSLLENVKTIQITDKIGYCWVDRSTSSSHNTNISYFIDYVDSAVLLCDIFTNRYNDVPNAEITLNRALCNFFYQCVGSENAAEVDFSRIAPLWNRLKKLCRVHNVKKIVPAAVYTQYLMCSVSLPLYVKIARLKKEIFNNGKN